MRCPRCGNRALGLVGWFGHSFYQPIWKDDRWVTHCRSCQTRLGPSARDRAFRFVLPMLAIFASFMVTAQLRYRVDGIVNAIIGVVVGVLVHYPLATYECLDAVPLPQARRQAN
jgi:hypothetical protein